MIEYVFPHYKAKEKEISKIQGLNRLFAYPTEPHFENNGHYVILDSGAYGLSLAKKQMTLKYMQDLSKHYEKFYRDNVLCIAPDVFQDSLKTIDNLKKWRRNNLFSKITPVLQNSEPYKINLSEINYQAKMYSDFGYKTVCFSINKGNANIYGQAGIKEVFTMLRQKRFQHIHLLGAGWNLQDIKNWLQIGGFNTMDSIAYYTTKDDKEFGSLNAIENINNILGVVGK